MRTEFPTIYISHHTVDMVHIYGVHQQKKPPKSFRNFLRIGLEFQGEII